LSASVRNGYKFGNSVQILLLEDSLNFGPVYGNVTEGIYYSVDHMTSLYKTNAKLFYFY